MGSWSFIYLSKQEAGGKFALDTAVVSRIHPEHKLPAAGEGNRQGVKDFLGVDTGGERV